MFLAELNRRAYMFLENFADLLKAFLEIFSLFYIAYNYKIDNREWGGEKSSNWASIQRTFSLYVMNATEIPDAMVRVFSQYTVQCSFKTQSIQDAKLGWLVNYLLHSNWL